MRGKTNEHRAHAIRVGLTEINRRLRNNVTFKTQDEWRLLLQEIIENDESLKDQPKNRKGRTLALTVERFEEALQTAASHGLNGVKNPKSAVFTHGSSVIDPAWLLTIDFEPEPAAEDAMQQQDRLASTPLLSLGQNPDQVRPVAAANAVKRAAHTEAEEIEDQPPSKKHKHDATGIQAGPTHNAGGSRDQFGSKVGLVETPQDQSSKRQPGIAQSSTEQPASTGTEAVRDRNETPQSPVMPNSANMSDLAKSLDIVGPPLIMDEMKAISRLIHNVAHTTLENIAEQRATWSTEPQEALRELYQLSFGDDYLGRFASMGALPLSGLDALQACVASALFRIVFKEQPPWDGPAAIMPRDKGDIDSINNYLKFADCKATLEQAIWHAAKAKLEAGGTFVKSELQYRAEDIAKKIAIILDRQLHELGAAGRCQLEDLAEVVCRALVLRGRLRAAPHYYDLEWIVSGVDYEPSKMEEVGRNTGKREVLFCTAPLVKWRATRAESWRVAAKAMVYARSV
ncbi:hypothetical protein LTR27_001555 [Elasticomyces elasticus]|nr:hypothetical protein LTR27_001555 [Elasticomyces elasticus]